MPWLANVRETVPGLPAVAEHVLGIAAKRSLPRWRRDTFLATCGSDDPDADVVLFADTFTNYFEPDNGHAAMSVLRAAGHRVAVARPQDERASRPLCCGRTYLASGLVENARREAQRLVDALAPKVAAGAAIVGLEPSCLLSLRDEFKVMRLAGDLERIASRALLIEELLARELATGGATLALNALPQKRALIHGHCHQKAFDVFTPALELLRRVPGLEVSPVTSSCCGMAGSFGYEAAHYDISLRMAELSLLPAVRAADADTLIVANGTSCRHQIADGTRASGAREAVHVVRVLAGALGQGPSA
jgi:Fe-S oxidoreductase